MFKKSYIIYIIALGVMFVIGALFGRCSQRDYSGEFETAQRNLERARESYNELEIEYSSAIAEVERIAEYQQRIEQLSRELETVNKELATAFARSQEYTARIENENREARAIIEELEKIINMY